MLQDAIEAADLPMNVNQLRGKLTVAHLVVGARSSRSPREGGTTTQAIEMNAAVGDALVDKVEADQAAELADDLEVINGEIERQQEIVDAAERAPTKAIQANVLGTLLQQRSEPPDRGPGPARGARRALRPRQAASARSRPGTPPSPSCWR